MDNEFIDKAQLEQKKAADEKKRKRTKNKKVKTGKPNAFVQILNGDFLTREFILNNLNFIFFVMFLLLMVVGKGYYGKRLSNEVNQTQKEVDEITSDYFELKAKLEEKTRRSELAKALEESELKETVNPTKVIRIKKKEASNE